MGRAWNYEVPVAGLFCSLLKVHDFGCGSNNEHKTASAELKPVRAPGPQSRLGPANQHAANVLPIIREAQKVGATTLRGLASS